MSYDFSIGYLYSHEEWNIYGFVIDLAFKLRVHSFLDRL